MLDSPGCSSRDRRSKRKDRHCDGESSNPTLDLPAYRSTRARQTGKDMHPKTEEKIMALSMITSDTRKWTAKVRVISKLGIRTASSSPLKYQKLILGDEMGNTVEAIIYKNDIDLYKDKLEDSITYKISNAQVSKANEMYKNDLINGAYQWTISSNTSVMPVYDDIIHHVSLRPIFLQYNKLAEFRDTKKPICIVCAVLGKQSPKMVFVRDQQEILYEYAFIDNQLNPFVVAFWGNVVSETTYAALDKCHERPVFALLNFIVKSYYGLSLSSTSSSIVLTEMDDETFAEMHGWCEDQRLFIDDIVEKCGLFEEKIGQISVDKASIAPISKILGSTEHGIFNVIVKGYIDNETQNFIYMCCEDCRRGINVDHNAIFNCNKCKTNKFAKPS